MKRYLKINNNSDQVFDTAEIDGFIGQMLLIAELKSMNINELERTRYIINKLIRRKKQTYGAIRNIKST